MNDDDRPRYYILVGRRVKRVYDVLTWGYWFEEHKRDDVRIVRQENVGRGWFASTVFIGLDHQLRDGPPLIFETMITGPRRIRRELREYAGAVRRYSTWPEAEDGHRALVTLLQAALAVAGGKVH